MCCPSLTDKASVSGAEDRGSIPLGSTSFFPMTLPTTLSRGADVTLLATILFSLLCFLNLLSPSNCLAQLDSTPPFSEYNTSEGICGYRPEKPIFKHYPKARRVLLPAIKEAPKSGALASMAKRRSRRDFDSRPLTLDELARLLYAAAGITGERWSIPLRTAPSGGALYPIEVYVVVHRVESLRQGVYHLAIEDFALERIRQGQWKKELAFASMDQTGKENEACTLVFTQMTQRIGQKYGSRGERYGWIELGAMLQNVLLLAEDLNLAAVPIGAFHDSHVRKILGIADFKEVPGILIPVGRRKKNSPDR